MVYYTIKLLVIYRKSQVLWGKPCRKPTSPDMQILGNTALRATHVPWTKRMEIFCFGVWENMGQLGKSTRNPLVLIVDHFLDLFVLLSLLLDGKHPLKIRFSHRKRRNITQKNRGFRRTADPYLRISHFG